MPRKLQRTTLTKSQMNSYGRNVQRTTLTAAQMEGAGIFGDIWKWVKKHKVISRGLSAVSGILPPGFSTVAKYAGHAAKFGGYGHPQRGGKLKGLSKQQVHAIASGLAQWLPSGGISLAAAKYIYPKIKNVLPSQVRGLAEGLGRVLKGGGISIRGGAASGLYMKGMGFSQSGGKFGPPRAAYAMPPNLAIARAVGVAPKRKPAKRAKPAMIPYRMRASGIKLAGQGGRRVKKKRYPRKKTKIIYRY